MSLAAFLLLFLTVTLTNAVPCSFAPECNCTFLSKTSVDAVCKDVSDFPDFTTTTDIDIKFLSIDGNFTDIPTKAFYNLDTHIENIFFQRSGNTIKTLNIAEDAFTTGPNGTIEGITFYDFEDLLSFPDLRGASGLKVVQLHRCGIETIKDNSFTGTKLTHLDVSNSHLRFIEVAAFNGIEDTLLHLQLDGNKLTEVSKAIQSLTKVTAIYLDGNLITEIPDNAFPPQISNIDFSNNPLDDLKFTSNTLGGITNLNSLRLNNCSLTKVPTVLYGDSFKNIQYFELSDNQITEITEDSFPPEYFRMTSYIPKLNNNPIETIAPAAFKAFKKVEAVAFINFYGLTNLDFDFLDGMDNLASVSIASCRKLINITLTSPALLPAQLIAIKVTESELILNLDSSFGEWMQRSSEHVLNLPDNGFRCTDEMKWMNEYEFCNLHPQILLDRSKCDDTRTPVQAYLFKQFDNNCS